MPRLGPKPTSIGRVGPSRPLNNPGAKTVRDNYNLKSNKYVCITSYQPDPKSNPNPIPNPNPTTKQHAIVNIQLSM